MEGLGVLGWVRATGVAGAEVDGWGEGRAVVGSYVAVGAVGMVDEVLDWRVWRRCPLQVGVILAGSSLMEMGRRQSSLLRCSTPLG